MSKASQSKAQRAFESAGKLVCSVEGCSNPGYGAVNGKLFCLGPDGHFNEASAAWVRPT